MSEQQKRLMQQWVSDLSGFDCRAVIGPIGALCGYVSVPQLHPWYGWNYGLVPLNEITYSLTYSGDMFSESGNVWTFGFDHGHSDHVESIDVDRDPPIIFTQDLEEICRQIVDLDKALFEVQQ